MNAYWQDIAALLTVAVALAWLARQIWLVLLKKQKPGCSGCSNCPTKEAAAEPPLVSLTLNATAKSLPKANA